MRNNHRFVTAVMASAILVLVSYCLGYPGKEQCVVTSGNGLQCSGMTPHSSPGCLMNMSGNAENDAAFCEGDVDNGFFNACTGCNSGQQRVDNVCIYSNGANYTCTLTGAPDDVCGKQYSSICTYQNNVGTSICSCNPDFATPSTVDCTFAKCRLVP